MNLKSMIARYWEKIQGSLFPFLEEELPPLSRHQQQLVSILELIRIEEFVSLYVPFSRGRPPKDRAAMARAFIVKAVYEIPTTVMLIDRLRSDISLRRICGFERLGQVPSESDFSRAFAAFAEAELPSKVHEALIRAAYKDEVVGHVVKDSTAIESRERPAKKRHDISSVPPAKKKPRGRPKKGTCRVVEVDDMTRIEKQAAGLMTLPEMLKDLPCYCDTGAKTNAKGHQHWWIGYKLHLAVDGQGVPLAALLSSASMHDSQAAIPLTEITAQRLINCYDLMDSAYYVPGILRHSVSLGHVPISEPPARGPLQKEEKNAEKKARETLKWKPAEMVRYEGRTVVERVFARCKDEFGALWVRVRGAKKVFTHLMFGILALTADQLLRIRT